MLEQSYTEMFLNLLRSLKEYSNKEQVYAHVQLMAGFQTFPKFLLGLIVVRLFDQ